MSFDANKQQNQYEGAAPQKDAACFREENEASFKEKDAAGLKEKENLEWEEIRVEHIVKDEWIDFRRSVYRFPDGKVFEPFYSYSRRDYVVIVASDEEGKYLCVRQFRQGIKKVTTEFPAGGIERTDGREYRSKCAGAVSGNAAENSQENAAENPVENAMESPLDAAEDTLEAAKRELLEETGYVSDAWRHMLSVPSHATIADNYAHIFVAEHCRKAGEQHLDETEWLGVRKYSAAEIEAMIEREEFQQAVHILAWLLAQRNR